MQAHVGLRVTDDRQKTSRTECDLKCKLKAQLPRTLTRSILRVLYKKALCKIRLDPCGRPKALLYPEIESRPEITSNTVK